MNRMKDITITLDLAPEVAAGLLRFAEKASYDHARSVLYPHVKAEIRDEQASQIITGFCKLVRTLSQAGVKSWPWVECGRVAEEERT